MARVLITGRPPGWEGPRHSNSSTTDTRSSCTHGTRRERALSRTSRIVRRVSCSVIWPAPRTPAALRTRPTPSAASTPSSTTPRSTSRSEPDRDARTPCPHPHCERHRAVPAHGMGRRAFQARVPQQRHASQRRHLTAGHRLDRTRPGTACRPTATASCSSRPSRSHSTWKASQNARASWIDPKRPGNSGKYFRVLKLASL